MLLEEKFSIHKSKILLGGLIGSLVIVFFFSYPAFELSLDIQDAVPVISLSAKDSQIMVGGEILTKASGLPLTEIFERTENGVVSVTVQRLTNALSSSAQGSGFVFDDIGHIITNNHVIENVNKISVTFIDGRSYKAELVATDPFSDIAVIKIDVDHSILHPLPIGDSSKLKVGERVAVIGNPFGLSGSMTSGIVSQLGRLLPSQETGFSIPDVIQTDAAINPGNSGGPLLNMNGEVIGITTAIYSNSRDFSGVGFSIPSNTVLKIVPRLIEDGEYKHPWIGVTSVNIDPNLSTILELEDTKGVLIMNVVKDGPADKAGIRGSSQTVQVDGIEYLIGGDVILSIDDIEIRQIDDIITYLQREKNVDDEINLGVIRNGQIMNFVIKLEQRPDA